MQRKACIIRPSIALHRQFFSGVSLVKLSGPLKSPFRHHHCNDLIDHGGRRDGPLHDLGAFRCRAA